MLNMFSSKDIIRMMNSKSYIHFYYGVWEKWNVYS
jgi:hypothetical protein